MTLEVAGVACYTPVWGLVGRAYASFRPERDKIITHTPRHVMIILM